MKKSFFTKTIIFFSLQGVYGAAAVVLALLLHVALLAGLLDALDGWRLLAVTGAAGALARAEMLVPALRLPYARDEGTGRELVAGLRRPLVLVAVLLALACAGVTWAVVGAGPAVWMVLAAAAVPWLVKAWAQRTLGGVTGDVLGAGAVLVQLAALLAALAALPVA